MLSLAETMIKLFKVKEKQRELAENANGKPPVKKQSAGELRLHKGHSFCCFPPPSLYLFVLSFHHMIKLQTFELVLSFCFPCDNNDVCHSYLQVLFFDSFISAFYITSSITYSWSKWIVYLFIYLDWKVEGEIIPLGYILNNLQWSQFVKWSLKFSPGPYSTCL